MKSNFLFVYFQGSAIRSKVAHLFGTVEMLIKLVPGNSAGTVAAYYVNFRLKIDITKLFVKSWLMFFFNESNDEYFFFLN